LILNIIAHSTIDFVPSYCNPFNARNCLKAGGDRDWPNWKASRNSNWACSNREAID
jgi:hypothetical protein